MSIITRNLLHIYNNLLSFWGYIEFGPNIQNGWTPIMLTQIQNTPLASVNTHAESKKCRECYGKQRMSYGHRHWANVTEMESEWK